MSVKQSQCLGMYCGGVNLTAKVWNVSFMMTDKYHEEGERKNKKEIVLN